MPEFGVPAWATASDRSLVCFQIHGDDASGASLDVSITCMTLSSRQQSIVTSHAYLAVEEISQGRIPMLLIHSNSFCHAASF